MRKIRILGVILVFLVCSKISVAQKQDRLRIAHINSAELLKLMPERNEAEAKLKEYAKTLEEQLNLMNKELETKYQDYLANETKMTEIIKQTKQKELLSLQQRIQEFQESAQEELKKKEAELVEPLLKKAQESIHKVAKERGYNYVLDTSNGAVLYFEDNDDILPFVKKDLGIQ